MSIDVLSRQVLVSGRITDSITGSRLRSPLRLSVLDDASGDTVAVLAAKVLPDGHYALFGDPGRLPTEAVDVRIVVSAPGYGDTTIVESFSTPQLDRINRTLLLGAETIDVRVVDDLPRSTDVVLAPDPIVLRGRVVRSEDTSQPIVGATVTVPAAGLGPVLTDADGGFALGEAPALPVDATITLHIEAVGRVAADIVFRPDYSKRINQGSFPLDEP